MLDLIRYKLKGPGTSFQVTFFVELFNKHFSFVILHKLAKLYQQTVSTPQDIK